MNRVVTRSLALLTLLAGTAPVLAEGLPPDPNDWVCEGPPFDWKAWCESDRDRRSEPVFAHRPAPLNEPRAKNDYDTELKQFLVGRKYSGWYHDRYRDDPASWRLTGPIVGPTSGSDVESYGSHPVVRIYYSPGVVDWLCSGREGEIAPGSMIIKEMVNFGSLAPGDIAVADDGCMDVTAALEPESWAVMVKGDGDTFDDWYWGNPSKSSDAFPPFWDASALTNPRFWDPTMPYGGPGKRNAGWYPTGIDFSKPSTDWSNVYPWSLFGAYCVNCHASAQSESTYSSLENVLTSGIRYRNFPASMADDEAETGIHSRSVGGPRDAGGDSGNGPSSPYPSPLAKPTPGFTDFFGDGGLQPASFAEAMALRMPSETRDHHPALPGRDTTFLTSDQCIGCHDATLSNAETPNMLVEDPRTGREVNLSPYGEWRVSPMGLAGRDPIFFSQLESEVINLPGVNGPHGCIETTCLHCHGVMGQRQLAADSEDPDAPCKDVFAIPPPSGVAFGKPFRRSVAQEWQQMPEAGYGALARDGISCTVCHRISAESLETGQAGYTGNFLTDQDNRLFGPYHDDTVVTKPMQNAIGRTPTFGGQLADSGICSSCHNILLPVFNNDGTPHTVTVPDCERGPEKTPCEIRATYEQTTGLEWQNSIYSQEGTFQSCQDCHMPGDFHGKDLERIKIANIEDADFAPTTFRLPDDEIRLTPRDSFARHSLHGLNVFLNQFFQQFPLMLGLRQIDYMIPGDVQPALVTGIQSMVEMAREETAKVEIVGTETVGDRLWVTVKVTNRTGHYLPSGVGFRRLFLEVEATAAGRRVFASGMTNSLGVIVDTSRCQSASLDACEPIAGENFYADPRAYQPHHQRIASPGQAQIYQELIRDSAGDFTTSFLRRIDDVKDNRLRGDGFRRTFFKQNPSPYIQQLAELHGEAANDPDYNAEVLDGSDQLVYEIVLHGTSPAAVRLTATLFSQSIPPFYLQQRFQDARKAPGANDDIRRLYYLASHLNTDTEPIREWKLLVASDCRHGDGSGCS